MWWVLHKDTTCCSVLRMNLDEIVEPSLLRQMIDEKYVKEQTHPTLPLKVLNYTDQCTWSRTWNNVTRLCRGLIVDSETNEVVARSLPKFFNAFEPGADEIGVDEPVVVTEKADGSLGVLFWAETEWQVATRGSFASEQAQHATKVWREKYAATVAPPQGWTMLFEIVFPSNRIVVDYGDMDDLVLLSAVEIATGRSVSPEKARDMSGWPGPVVETLPFTSLTEALAAEPKPNAEGFVIHAPRTEARQKTKFSEYVRLHRLLTGLTARRLWEYLAVKAVAPTAVLGKKEKTPTDYMVRRLHMAPERIDEVMASPEDWQEALVDRVPEEFEQWVRTRVREIVDAVDRERADVEAAFLNVRSGFGEVPSSGAARGEFVRSAQVQYPEDWQLLMAQLDGMPVEAAVWERHRPAAERAFAQQSEDVA